MQLINSFKTIRQSIHCILCNVKICDNCIITNKKTLRSCQVEKWEKIRILHQIYGNTLQNIPYFIYLHIVCKLCVRWFSKVINDAFWNGFQWMKRYVVKR